MRIHWLLLALFFMISALSFSQDLGTELLDAYFTSLEEREEMMGSITLSRAGRVIYTKAIGFRHIHGQKKIPADTATRYRIWSITKLYTATMIMQLAEEGQLALDTKLARFYPQLPHADGITIKNLLMHTSGLHDFTQNDTEEDWDTYMTAPKTPEFMVAHIAKYPPDFPPGEAFRYSNSNYLLLGYIIETLDGNRYENSLARRISAKLGLQATYFGVGALDTVENKAFSYTYKNQWIPVDEGGFSGLIPAGAGGIVATPNDMNRFIQGLFSGELVSQASLARMIPEKGDYGLGLMRTFFQGSTQGFGHTGGFTATESSLFYYPEEQLSIAFTTNGFVLRKEEILENVLKIYHDQPFDISMNRALQTLLIWGLGLLLFLVFRRPLAQYLKTEHWAILGYVVVALFWVGSFLSGQVAGDHSIIRDGVTQLDAFYGASGTLMSGIQLTMALLLLPYLYGLYIRTRVWGLSRAPLIPLCILPLSLLGSSLFPFPDPLYQIFTNAILFVMLGPLLAPLMWRKKMGAPLRWWALACFTLMLMALLLLLSRASIPEIAYSYWGLIQRVFYLGWTLWLCLLAYYLTSKNA